MMALGVDVPLFLYLSPISLSLSLSLSPPLCFIPSLFPLPPSLPPSSPPHVYGFTQRCTYLSASSCASTQRVNPQLASSTSRRCSVVRTGSPA